MEYNNELTKGNTRGKGWINGIAMEIVMKMTIIICKIEE